MSRRCSHCGHNGHNSRTCPNRGVKLFGVRLVADRMIRKSVSMGNLSHYTASASASSCNNNPALTPEQSESAAADDGYVSDGMVQTSKSRERKKGVPWTEHEHKMFLVGLQKLGKGDWRGISRNFVTSRTPTQVASHAQKYFLRQSNLNKRKRRSSLFDLSADTVGECNTRIPEFSPAIHELALNKTLPLTSGSFFETGHSPNLAMSLGAFSVPPFAPNLVNPTYLSLRMSRPEKVEADKIAEEESKYSVRAEGSEFGGYFRPNHIIPCSFPLPLWPDLETSTTNTTSSSATSPPNIEAEESVEKSSLSLSIAPPCVDPPQQSAFHSNNMGSSSNAIRVV